MFISTVNPYTGKETMLVSQHTENVLRLKEPKKFTFSRKAEDKSPQRGRLRTLEAWETGLQLGTQEVQK